MAANARTAGLLASVGKLELELLYPPPHFVRDGRAHTTATITADGAMIGRNAAADIVIGGGSNSDYVSNFHVFIGYSTTSGVWTARDNDSTWGTTADRDERHVDLSPGLSLPIGDGVVLTLARNVAIGVTHRRPTLERTRDATGGGRPSPSWIAHPDEQRLAEFLVQFAREGRPAGRISADDIKNATGLTGGTAARRRRALAAYPEVQRLVPTAVQEVTFVMLAELLPRAFPYLLDE